MVVADVVVVKLVVIAAVAGHLFLSDEIDPGECMNMDLLSALEVAQAPHRVREKDLALRNMFTIFVAADTSHKLRSRLKASAVWNMASNVVTLDTVHLEISPLNFLANANMPFIFVTLDTSHLEMSPIKCSEYLT
jgi:hypothetical protein